MSVGVASVGGVAVGGASSSGGVCFNSGDAGDGGAAGGLVGCGSGMGLVAGVGGVGGLEPSSSSNHPFSSTSVYVCLRPFRLPRPLAAVPAMKHVPHFFADVGFGHYLVYLRDDESASTKRVDFGPVGGEVGLRRKQGEVRVRDLDAQGADDVLSLPTVSFVGRAQMGMDDMVALAEAEKSKRVHYELLRSDCRHFVNDVCGQTVGIRNAARHAVRARHAELTRRQMKNALGVHPAPTPADSPVLKFGWSATNVDNAAHVRAAGTGAGAFAVAHCAVHLARAGTAIPMLAMNAAVGVTAKWFAAARVRAAAKVAAGVMGAGSVEAETTTRCLEEGFGNSRRRWNEPTSRGVVSARRNVRKDETHRGRGGDEDENSPNSSSRRSSPSNSWRLPFAFTPSVL